MEYAEDAPVGAAMVEARGQIVKKKLKADHPLAVEFEYVLWVPKDYAPDRTWRLIVSLHGQSGNGGRVAPATVHPSPSTARPRIPAVRPISRDGRLSCGRMRV